LAPFSVIGLLDSLKNGVNSFQEHEITKSDFRSVEVNSMPCECGSEGEESNSWLPGAFDGGAVLVSLIFAVPARAFDGGGAIEFLSICVSAKRLDSSWA
jgi:hypothetical protein